MRPYRFPIAIMVLALLAQGCDGDDEEQPPSPAADEEPSSGERPDPASEPRDTDAQGPRLLRRQRSMMGTVFRITVADAPPHKAHRAMNEALDEIARLEELLSEWLPDSEISQINEAAGDHPVEVSGETFTVVDAGVDVSRWSKGAFDLSWAALRGLYDFRPGHHDKPEPEEIDERVARIRWKDILLDEDDQTVFLKEGDMAIGTGGIAKGYALDRASDILEEADLDSFMLFGGGQVQVHGMKGDRPWRVGIQHPRRLEDYFGFVEAEEASISTSGDYEHSFIDDEGTRWHHILDPRTGRPARKSMSVTVIAPTGLYADALSTAAFVLGPERAKELFQRIPYDAEMVMVDADCRLVMTEGAADNLRLRVELRNGRLPGCSGAAE